MSHLSRRRRWSIVADVRVTSQLEVVVVGSLSCTGTGRMATVDNDPRPRRRQHGVVARRPSSPRSVSAAGGDDGPLVAGRLERVSARGFLRVRARRVTPAAAGDGCCSRRAPAAVAIQSAAALWRMPASSLEPVHVLASRRPHRDRNRVGRMHSSVRLRDEDVTTIDGIPVTTPLRTLRDLAGRIHPERLSQTCDRMLSQRLIRLPDLHALIDELSRTRWCPRHGGAPSADPRPAGWLPTGRQQPRAPVRVDPRGGRRGAVRPPGRGRRRAMASSGVSTSSIETSG